jgi:hypothetical protein
VSPMHEREPKSAFGTTLVETGCNAGISAAGCNSVQGYVGPRRSLPTLLLRPGVVVGEVLLANLVAITANNALYPATYLYLPGQRQFAATFNAILACALLTLYLAQRYWSKRGQSTLQYQKAVLAGAAMALLTGLTLYVSIGNTGLPPAILLVMTLVCGGRSVRNARHGGAAALLSAAARSNEVQLLPLGDSVRTY